jgi:hypothetical protein
MIVMTLPLLRTQLKTAEPRRHPVICPVRFVVSGVSKTPRVATHFENPVTAQTQISPATEKELFAHRVVLQPIDGSLVADATKQRKNLEKNKSRAWRAPLSMFIGNIEG